MTSNENGNKSTHQPRPNPLPPYGTAIRNAVASNNAADLTIHIGTIEMSLIELAKSDAQALAKMTSKQLSKAQIDKLMKSLKTLREVLDL